MGEENHYAIELSGVLEYYQNRAQFKFHSGAFPVWAMIAVEDGVFTYTIGDKQGEAHAGDVLFCPPDLPFNRQITSPLSYMYLCFRIRPRQDGSNDDAIIDLLRERYHYTFTTTERDRFNNNFRQLLRLHAHADKTSKRWMTHFVNDIWSLFAMEAELFLQYGNVAQDPLMQQAKIQIESRAFQPMHLRDVADALGLHPVQLTRRFQHVFGSTPSRYLLSLRMERAKLLLLKTDYTLEHIAELCGYDNGHYLSRTFTQYTHMNPSTYRKQAGRIVDSV